MQTRRVPGSTALNLDDDLAIESSPMLRSRYACVGLAKQLWLTTPLAMKSPVPVVKSYIGSRRQRLDGGNLQMASSTSVRGGDVAFACDGGIGEVKQAQNLRKTANRRTLPHWVGFWGSMTNAIRKALETAGDPVNDLKVICSRCGIHGRC